jgi:hypothetical protein
MENKKEAILAMSRKLKHDEGMDAATNKGSRLADYTVGAFGAIVVSVALFYGEFAAAWAVMIIICAYGFGLFLSLFRFAKGRMNLFLTFWSALMMAVFFVLFLAATNGWWIF